MFRVPSPRLKLFTPGVCLVGAACLVLPLLPWLALLVGVLGAFLMGVSFWEPPRALPPPPVMAPPPLPPADDTEERLAELAIAVERREAALRQAQAQTYELEEQLAELRQHVEQWRKLAGEAAEAAQVKVGEELAGRRLQVEQLRQAAQVGEGKLRQTLALVQSLTQEKERLTLECAALTQRVTHQASELGQLEAEKLALAAAQEEARTQVASLRVVEDKGRHHLQELEGELGELRDRLQAREEEFSLELRQAQHSLKQALTLQEQLQTQLATWQQEAQAVKDPSDWMAGVGLAFVVVSAEGWVEMASPELETLLALPDGGVGLDEWSFGVEVLAPRCESPERVLADQGNLLEGLSTWWCQGLMLLDGTPLVRLVLPLAEGGRVEIFVPMPDLVMGEQALQALTQVEYTLSSPGGGPSAATTLQAILRQLEELSSLLPREEAGEAQARLSTARALLGGLAREPGPGPADPQVRTALRRLRVLLHG